MLVCRKCNKDMHRRLIPRILIKIVMSYVKIIRIELYLKITVFGLGINDLGQDAEIKSCLVIFQTLGS
jgi:hypothetical protein